MPIENPAAPPAAQTPAPAAPAPAAPQTVTIPLEQLQAFASVQARLGQIEAEREAARVAADREQAEGRARQGQLEDALRQLREQSEQQLQAERDRAAQVERDAARYALDGELSRALAGRTDLAGPDAAEQLTQLWRGQFTAVRENGTFAVRTPTFETPAQYVQRMLASPSYAHFLRPGTTGGTQTGAAPAAAPAAPPHPAAPPQPRNMGEAVILHMQGIQKEQGDARANMALPLGLKAAR